MRKQIIYLILGVLSVVNLILAIIIQIQKNANEHAGPLKGDYADPKLMRHMLFGAKPLAAEFSLAKR